MSEVRGRRSLDYVRPYQPPVSVPRRPREPAIPTPVFGLILAAVTVCGVLCYIYNTNCILHVRAHTVAGLDMLEPGYISNQSSTAKFPYVQVGNPPRQMRAGPCHTVWAIAARLLPMHDPMELSLKLTTLPFVFHSFVAWVLTNHLNAMALVPDYIPATLKSIFKWQVSSITSVVHGLFTYTTTELQEHYPHTECWDMTGFFCTVTVQNNDTVPWFLYKVRAHEHIASAYVIPPRITRFGNKTIFYDVGPFYFPVMEIFLLAALIIFMYSMLPMGEYVSMVIMVFFSVVIPLMDVSLLAVFVAIFFWIMPPFRAPSMLYNIMKRIYKFVIFWTAILFFVAEFSLSCFGLCNDTGYIASIRGFMSTVTVIAVLVMYKIMNMIVDNSRYAYRYQVLAGLLVCCFIFTFYYYISNSLNFNWADILNMWWEMNDALFGGSVTNSGNVPGNGPDTGSNSIFDYITTIAKSATNYIAPTVGMIWLVPGVLSYAVAIQPYVPVAFATAKTAIAGVFALSTKVQSMIAISASVATFAEMMFNVSSTVFGITTPDVIQQ